MLRNVLLLAIGLGFVALAGFLAIKAETAQETRFALTTALFFGGAAAVSALDIIGQVWPARPVRGADHLHLKNNRLRCGVMGLASAAWCAAGVLGLGVASLPTLLAWALIAFGGAGALVLVTFALDGRVKVIVDREGFADYRLIDGKIPWPDIRAARVSFEAGVPLVAVWLVDPAAWATRRTWTARIFRRRMDPLQVMDVQLAGHVGHIGDAIEAFAPRAVWDLDDR